MIHSMTGYAAQMRDIGRGILHLELRTVNSRYLDMNFRIAEEVRIVEPALREMIAARLNRGKVDCRLNLLPSATAPREASLNRALLQQLAALQAGVRDQLPEAAALSVNEVLRWPGMLGDDQIGADTLQAECAALAKSALDELLATRAREGGKLGAMILERVERMRTLVAEAAPKLPQALADYQERMAIRLREAAASLDEERIRQEMGLFATRVDVAEELNREANTLASKSVSSDITAIAVDMKLLIEQMREQVQNIE